MSLRKITELQERMQRLQREMTTLQQQIERLDPTPEVAQRTITLWENRQTGMTSCRVGHPGEFKKNMRALGSAVVTVTEGEFNMLPEHRPFWDDPIDGV